MMRWVVASSLRFRFLIAAAAAALMFFGVAQVRAMPVDVFPEFAPPQIEVQTPCLGLSAAEVEALVTVPLEQALNGMPGIDVVRSQSIPQLSSIVMIFKQGIDILEARQLVQERLTTVTPTLPSWASPPSIMPQKSATSRVMKIGISSNTLSLIDLSLVSHWTIRARLLRVPGVANVAIWGERLKMPQVQIDPERLRAAGVSLATIMQVTADALDVGVLKFASGSTVGTGGFIETADQRMQVRHVLPIVTPRDLARVPVGIRDGKPLRLGDVANVVIDHQPLIGDAVIDSGPGLLLVVEKFPAANTLDVTHGVESALASMRPGLPGVQLDSTIFRPASFIDSAIHNLTAALLLGCLFVVLILFAFLFEWRTVLISLIAIPISLMAAGLVLSFRGATINTMILAGLVIAIGVVVDDAIIDIENIMRRLRQARAEGSEKSTARIILDGSLEVRSAIIHATLIDAAALLPVLFLGGLSGAFFRPLAVSYALAVVASMFVALTITPALALILLSRAPLERKESVISTWLKRGYSNVLARAIRAPLVVYVLVGVMVLMGTAVVPALGESLFPKFKERDFLIHWVTKPGTSLPEETRIVTAVSKELRAIPGVRNFGSHIGQARLADEIVGANAGENWISIDPKADYDATLAAIQKVVQSYPGLFHDVLTYLNERIDEVLTGSSQAVVLRIFGQDLNVLRSKAAEVKQVLAKIPGVVESQVEFQVEEPQIDVKVNLASAERYRIKPGDVRRAAATMMASEEVGDIFRGGKAYGVAVWSTPSTRHSLTDIRDLLLDTPSGGHVRLAQVADVRLMPAPNVIKRENSSRRIDVGANVRGRDLGSVIHDIRQQLGGVAFPLGYHTEVLGEYAERQAAQKRMLRFALAGALAILLLLMAAFRSWRLAAMSFMTLPMALVGGLVAIYLSGGVISLGALVGFFTVFGIAARNGIMQITHYRHLEKSEDETFGPALVLRGSRERLAPILMTALATGLALIPLAIVGDIPGHEIEHPMAIVILGGLVTSTLLNLFVVPSLYLRFGKGRRSHAEAIVTD